jgi:ATP adenylyltransferase
MTYLQSDSSSGGGECIFCRKARGADDTADHVLYRGQHVFVTLNLFPYNNGHMMVVPYAHIARLVDLEEPGALELMTVTQRCLEVLRQAFNPQGFNLGMNIGSAAGAGIAEHIHQHIVPRWGGDTNFLTTIGETRTIPEWIDQTYERLKPLF